MSNPTHDAGADAAAKERNREFTIFINKKKVTTSAESLTGAEIKALAGYGAEFDLFLLQGEGDPAGRAIADGDRVEIKNGLHFRVLPGNRNFGREPHPDIVHRIEELRAHGYSVAMRLETDDWIGLIIDPFPIPSKAFNAPATRLLLRAPRDPNAALDMFWTSPNLLLSDGRVPKNAESMERHFGEDWRRFSWHYNVAQRPSRDGLLTFVSFVDDRFARGV